ncbi:hypothetical protein PBAL39_18924 [Pedobacter sp. BAL39]|nr:hypothetical protein PBAL39_18924 [Pedobacter sp. BAL39]
MKKRCLLIIFLLAASNCFAQSPDQTTTTIIGSGIGIGSALAVAICWTRTNSVLTSAIAGFFGWFFVIYYLIIRNREQ